jgi:tetratricopeptide (TPR) repeat protein
MCERYPQSARLLHLLGASRLARGLNAEALDVLLKANRLAAADAGILRLLGVALFRLGRHDEARLRFEQSLASEPDSYETLVNASANALAAGDVEGGRRLAEQALRVQADGVGAMLNLANALVAARRGTEAVELLRRAIAVEPNSAVLYLNLGNLLTDLGRADEAVVALQEALRRRPDLAPAHLNLGRALHDLGENELAQRHLRAASDLDPRLAQAHSAYLCSLAHDATVSPQRVFEEHLRIGDLLEAPHRGAWQAHGNDRDPERALRLGFVSPICASIRSPISLSRCGVICVVDPTA